MPFNLKSVLSVFAEIEEKPKQQTPQKTAQPQQTIVRDTPVPIAGYDEKIAEKLLDALQAASTPEIGFGYLEFKSAMADMRESISDEATRFKMAFAAAKAMKITSQQMIDNASKFVEVLAKERKEFLDRVKSKSETDIQQKINQLKETDQKLSDNQKEIDRLNREMITLQDTKAKLSGTVAEANQRIENTKNSFEATFDQINTGIKEDIKKIRAYIGGSTEK